MPRPVVSHSQLLEQVVIHEAERCGPGNNWKQPCRRSWEQEPVIHLPRWQRLVGHRLRLCFHHSLQARLNPSHQGDIRSPSWIIRDAESLPCSVASTGAVHWLRRIETKPPKLLALNTAQLSGRPQAKRRPLVPYSTSDGICSYEVLASLNALERTSAIKKCHFPRCNIAFGFCKRVQTGKPREDSEVARSVVGIFTSSRYSRKRPSSA